MFHDMLGMRLTLFCRCSSIFAFKSSFAFKHLHSSEDHFLFHIISDGQDIISVGTVEQEVHFPPHILSTPAAQLPRHPAGVRGRGTADCLGTRGNEQAGPPGVAKRGTLCGACLEAEDSEREATARWLDSSWGRAA